MTFEDAMKAAKGQGIRHPDMGEGYKVVMHLGTAHMQYPNNAVWRGRKVHFRPGDVEAIREDWEVAPT